MKKTNVYELSKELQRAFIDIISSDNLQVQPNPLHFDFVTHLSQLSSGSAAPIFYPDVYPDIYFVMTPDETVAVMGIPIQHPDINAKLANIYVLGRNPVGEYVNEAFLATTLFSSIAISDDGRVIATGNPDSSQNGAAVVYEECSGFWRVAKILCVLEPEIAAFGKKVSFIEGSNTDIVVRAEKAGLGSDVMFFYTNKTGDWTRYSVATTAESTTPLAPTAEELLRKLLKQFTVWDHGNKCGLCFSYIEGTTLRSVMDDGEDFERALLPYLDEEEATELKSTFKN